MKRAIEGWRWRVTRLQSLPFTARSKSTQRRSVTPFQVTGPSTTSFGRCLQACALSLTREPSRTARASTSSPDGKPTTERHLASGSAQLDIKLLKEDGSAARPWLMIVIDDHSRAIAGYYLGFDAPSAMRTSLALRQGIWRKGHPHCRFAVCPTSSTRTTEQFLPPSTSNK